MGIFLPFLALKKVLALFFSSILLAHIFIPLPDHRHLHLTREKNSEIENPKEQGTKEGTCPNVTPFGPVNLSLTEKVWITEKPLTITSNHQPKSGQPFRPPPPPPCFQFHLSIFVMALFVVIFILSLCVWRKDRKVKKLKTKLAKLRQQVFEIETTDVVSFQPLPPGLLLTIIVIFSQLAISDAACVCENGIMCDEAGDTIQSVLTIPQPCRDSAKSLSLSTVRQFCKSGYELTKIMPSLQQVYMDSTSSCPCLCGQGLVISCSGRNCLCNNCSCLCGVTTPAPAAKTSTDVSLEIDENEEESYICYYANYLLGLWDSVFQWRKMTKEAEFNPHVDSTFALTSSAEISQETGSTSTRHIRFTTSEPKTSTKFEPKTVSMYQTASSSTSKIQTTSASIPHPVKSTDRGTTLPPRITYRRKSTAQSIGSTLVTDKSTIQPHGVSSSPTAPIRLTETSTGIHQTTPVEPKNSFPNSGEQNIITPQEDTAWYKPRPTEYALGSVIVVILVAIGIYVCCRKKRGTRNTEVGEPGSDNGGGQNPGTNNGSMHDPAILEIGDGNSSAGTAEGSSGANADHNQPSFQPNTPQVMMVKKKIKFSLFN